MTESLTVRLLAALILPATAVALILGVGGAIMIQSIVEKVSDRLLISSARSIADTLAFEGDGLAIALPQSSFSMLENDQRDNIYYSVFRGPRLLTGYPDLPRIVPRLDDPEGATFSDVFYRNEPIRLVSIVRRIPTVDQPILVQVAETVHARHSLRNRLLLGLIVLELALICALILLLPLAVRWGLKPLSNVRQEVDCRKPADFTPLSLTGVPSELKSYFTAFNDLLLRLNDAVEGMRRFTADASHQLRTPLSVLRAHVQVVRRAGLDSDVGRASMTDIEAAVIRLQRLLVQLLALARAEGDQENIAALATPVDLVGLARSVTEEHVTAALRASMDIQFTVEGICTPVITVDALVREMIANLVDNAIRYNHPQGTVIVSVTAAGSGIVVAVEDSGPGIPPSERENVLRRFRRLDRDQKREGSGLGLAIVDTLARNAGSELRLCDSHLGGLRAELHFVAARQGVES